MEYLIRYSFFIYFVRAKIDKIMLRITSSFKLSGLFPPVLQK
ncbi:hypothetical protein H004_00311 [Escherichia coli UMEA 4207-1]|jgi:hypothetical protein|nr:hypothetical protein A31G_02361 [Escherichia coli KTE161]EQX67649.1 hypothetical protein G933_02814 [Escherichia coli UMEA 3180-1]ERA48849.1 hypothetical protein H004_00311 [Escherichia coli UMEA 4207-1]CAD5540708.1 Uncharacterised protein [Escherichia coli]CAD5562763.1 Uncharacterised protein [Escherichia coli]